MNPQTIKIDSMEYVRKDSIPAPVPTQPGTPIGRYSIVRCRDAGVWFGLVSGVDGRNCELRNARRLWTWKAEKGHTLSAVANYGLASGKLPAAVDQVFLQEICEIVPVTSIGETSIMNHPEYTP